MVGSAAAGVNGCFNIYRLLNGVARLTISQIDRRSRREKMHVAPLALVVLAAVTAMVDTAWHVSPGETGGSRTRPNRRAPKGKVWRTSLDADIRRQPPTLAPAGSSTPTGVTNPELGHSQSGQVTGDLVSPTVVAAAPEADEHASDTEATKEAH